MATRSSILAWKIPWTEEPGGLQSMELQRVGHSWKAEYTTALYVKDNNKDLLYSTGNSIFCNNLYGKRI